MKKLFLPVLFSISTLLFVNFTNEFGFNAEEQSFKKLTIEYREFQGNNKKAYKLEEVIKNEKGWITAHNYYDQAGTLIEGSYSIVYDNNGNIKEKKFNMLNPTTKKITSQRITYNNTFANGKIKQSVITDKENPQAIDSITYYRNNAGELTAKRAKTGDITKITYYNKEGKPEKETELVEGKLSIQRTFDYSAQGLKKITGKNTKNEEVQVYSFEYNEKGKLYKVDKKYSGLDIDFHATYKYNQTGQLINEERTDKGTKNIIVYEYLDNGLLGKVSVKNDQSIRINERVYTYE